MTDEREITKFIDMAVYAGADVKFSRSLDADGRFWTDSVQVIGLKGCGPHPMGPIAFVERMREIFAA